MDWKGDETGGGGASPLPSIGQNCIFSGGCEANFESLPFDDEMMS